MRLLPVGCLLLALAGASSAGTEPLLEVVYENATSLGSCVAGSVHLQAGVALDLDARPPVQLTAPGIAPPSPSCLALPL